MTKNILTEKLIAPLNGARTARVDIQAGDGNLTIDPYTSGEQLLASGTLQYQEGQGMPTQTLDANNGQAILTLRGGGSQRWFRLPWAACNVATEWKIHLNPTVSYDLTAHNDGGNVMLNLASLAVTRVEADTGGGNVDVALPDNATNLHVTARTGAGNVTVDVPSGVAARIQAITGLGQAIIEARFNKVDKDTYQSPDFDKAFKKVEITAKSGAGNVIVKNL